MLADSVQRLHHESGLAVARTELYALSTVEIARMTGQEGDNILVVLRGRFAVTLNQMDPGSLRKNRARRVK